MTKKFRIALAATTAAGLYRSWPSIQCKLADKLDGLEAFLDAREERKNREDLLRRQHLYDTPVCWPVETRPTMSRQRC